MFNSYKPQDTSLLTLHMSYLPHYHYSLHSMHRHTQLYSEHLNVCHQEKEVRNTEQQLTLYWLL